jgi:nucleoside-diphosphate-sugar epimerase
MAVVALTGATGFIGGHLAEALHHQGYEVRALSRRPSARFGETGIRVVHGSLENEASLVDLLRGADAVVHAAGAVRASCQAAYRQANTHGTARLVKEAARRDGRQFVLISSLAARQPHLSFYAESKAMAETAAQRFSDRLALTIVRPPAVYGPGDRMTLPLIGALSRGWLVAPAAPTARFSLIYVSDLVRLILALLAPTGLRHVVVEPDDGRANGYAWRDLATIAEASFERRVRVVRVAKGPVRTMAGLLDLCAGALGRLSPLPRDKVEEIFHPDWVCDTRSLAALPAWRPMTELGRGLQSALSWYRSAGWL